MAEESNKVVAEPRDSFCKGAARKIRAAGKIPAVVYGHGTDPQHVTVPAHQVGLLLRKANAVLELDISGKTQLALVKDVQKDPVLQIIEHLDLLRHRDEGAAGRRHSHHALLGATQPDQPRRGRHERLLDERSGRRGRDEADAQVRQREDPLAHTHRRPDRIHRGAAVLAMRRPAKLGQTERALHENATSKSLPHVSQWARTKPCASAHPAAAHAGIRPQCGTCFCRQNGAGWQFRIVRAQRN